MPPSQSERDTLQVELAWSKKELNLQKIYEKNKRFFHPSIKEVE
jgi:hypothetical protein